MSAGEWFVTIAIVSLVGVPGLVFFVRQWPRRERSTDPCENTAMGCDHPRSEHRRGKGSCWAKRETLDGKEVLCGCGGFQKG